MTIFNINIWLLLGILSVGALIIFWKHKNAVWGGLTFGGVIGLIVALVFIFIEKPFHWSFIYKGMIIGVLAGVIVQFLGFLSDYLKERRQTHQAKLNTGISEKKRYKYWLRWIAMIPIAVLVMVLVEILLHLILYWTLSGGENPFISPYPELPERILAPFFRGFLFVWVSAKIAPDYKVRTAIILSAFWILTAVIIYVLALLDVNLGGIHIYLIASGLPPLMGIIGALAGIFITRRKQRQG